MADLRRKFFWILLLHSVVGTPWVVHGKEILTLEEAERLYLSRNPEVEAARQQMEMARGEFRQAGMLSNPQLNYSQEGFPFGNEAPSSFGDQEFLVWATQKLELGGKRVHRKEAARLRLQASGDAFENMLRLRTSELKETFALAYFAQKKRELTRQHLSEYRQIRDIHQNRYEAGDVSGLAQLRIELEEVRFLSVLSQAETDFIAAWNELAALINWPDNDLPRLEMSLTPLPEITLEELKELAFRSRPDLTGLGSRIAEMEENVELEKAQRIPDLTLGGGYKRDFGVDSFYAAVHLPIPLFDRNQGAIYEAQAGLRRTENQRLWKRIQIGREVQRAFETYQSQQSHVNGLREDLLVRAEDAVETTRSSYQEGEATLTDYLDALRVRLDVSVAYYDLLFQVQRSRIAMEKATGAQLK